MTLLLNPACWIPSVDRLEKGVVLGEDVVGVLVANQGRAGLRCGDGRGRDSDVLGRHRAPRAVPMHQGLRAGFIRQRRRGVGVRLKQDVRLPVRVGDRPVRRSLGKVGGLQRLVRELVVAEALYRPGGTGLRWKLVLDEHRDVVALGVGEGIRRQRDRNPVGDNRARASATAWLMHAAVPDGLACALHECSVSPTLLSAVPRVPLLIANTGTESESGMYQMLLPRSERTLIGGPGGGKFVVALLAWATNAFARATPRLALTPGGRSVDEPVVELPQAAASSAVAATAANFAASRKGCEEARCPVISGCRSFLFQGSGAGYVAARLRRRVVSITATISAAP